MSDFTDYDSSIMYALTWCDPVGRHLYWSLTKGWTADPEQAWVLDLEEIEAIENELDERLTCKLPQHSQRKEDAEWKPLYRRNYL